MESSSVASSMPAALGTAFEFVVQGCLDMIDIITANPVLSLGIAAWCVGLAIGLFKRLV